MCGPQAIIKSFAYGIVDLQQGYGLHFNICDTSSSYVSFNYSILTWPFKHLTYIKEDINYNGDVETKVTNGVKGENPQGRA